MTGHADPKRNGVWSPSEIKTMKSLIRRHNKSNNDGQDIVDVLQERFSYKEKQQVTDMCVDIVVEMMQTSHLQEGGGGGMAGGNVNNQPIEEPAVDNAAVVAAPPVPHPAPVWYARAGRYWTQEEHRLFLNGLRMYGRRNWRDISMLVETRTPLQVSIHAQKFFRLQKKEAMKQRILPRGRDPLTPASTSNSQATGTDDQQK